MKKWSFLVAALLTMSATVLTTSCIDNDEPEGITVLRGAKAELLKAKAALELAKAETEKQTANLQAAHAATQQAIAKQEEAKVAIVNAQAKKAEAEAAYAAAQADSMSAAAEYAKAQAMKEIEDANFTIEKNKLALDSLKAKQEAIMLDIQKQVADNKATLENTLAEIEAAKAVLTDVQAKKLETLQEALYGKDGKSGAWGKYMGAQAEILKAAKALYDAANDHAKDVEDYEKDVKDAQADLDAAQAVLEELESLKGANITKWDEELESLKKVPEAIALEKEEIELEIMRIEQSQAYKDSVKAKEDAELAYNQAKGEATEDNVEYAVSPVSIPVTNSYIKGIEYESGKYIEDLLDSDGNLSASYKDDKATYDVLSADDEKIATAIESWETAMKKAKLDAENLQLAKCELEAEQKDLVKKDSIHNAKVEIWKKMHQQHEDGKALVTVKTDLVVNAVNAYNTALKNLVSKVDEYNKAYDKALADQTKVVYDALVDAYNVVAYKDFIDSKLGSSISSLQKTDPKMSAAETLTEITEIVNFYKAEIKLAGIMDLDSSDKVLAAAKKQAAKDFAYDELEEDFTKEAKKQALAGVEKNNTVTCKTYTTVKFASAVTPVTSVEAVTKAKTAYLEAIEKDGKTGAKVMFNKLADANIDYAALAKENAQIIVDKDGKDVAEADQAAYAEGLYNPASGMKDNGYYTGVSGETKTAPKGNIVADTYVVDEYVWNDKASKAEPTSHMKVVRTEISDETVKALTAVAFNEAYGTSAWVTASTTAFGGTKGLHAEPKVDDCEGGTGKDLKDQQDKVNGLQDKVAALTDADTINNAIAAAKTQLEQEKSAADTAVENAKTAFDNASDAVTNMTKDLEDQAGNLATKQGEMEALRTKLEFVVEAYYNSIEIKYTDENGDPQYITPTSTEDLETILKGLIKTQKEAVETAEENLKDAQRTLDNYLNDADFDAVAEAQLALDRAKEELVIAQRDYDFAASQLEAYMEALSK